MITLLTDFGTRDGYVGQMKGTIFSIAPSTQVVDISHDIDPHDVMGGAVVWESTVDCFPAGTVHVGVVDPGVGGDRSAIAVRTDRCFFVGPDNGLLTAILDRHRLEEAVCLTNPAYHRRPVSHTFHGRDIFAPVAAHLANGTPIRDMGQPLGAPMRLALTAPLAKGDRLEIHVVYADRFGNLLTDLTTERYERWQAKHGSSPTNTTIQVGNHTIDRISRTFSDAALDQTVAYFGSGGRLELAVRNGSAAKALGGRSGTICYLAAGELT